MPLSTIMCCLSSIAVGSPLSAHCSIWSSSDSVGYLSQLGGDPADVLQQQRDDGVGPALDRGR